MHLENYFPQVFLPQSLAHAKDIVLSSDPTGEKWMRQTEDTAHAIVRSFAALGKPLTRESLLLDYGCGIGRVAKRLIELTGCTVLGLDISPGMLYFSLPYVNSERFIPCPQMQLEALVRAGLRASGAIAIWALQHCENPAEDIAQIHRALQPGAPFFVTNKFSRYLPVTPTSPFARWHDDGMDVVAAIQEKFSFVQEIPSPETTAEDYCRLFQRA